MKKTLLMIALAFLCGSANAQIDSVDLGYCEGQINTNTSDEFSLVGTAGYVSAAVRIPAEVISLYGGCNVEEIHAALASTLNIDELTLWLREDLQGENLSAVTITKSTDPKISKGWNNLTLPEAYVISDEAKDLYIGLTLHQKNTSVGLSVLKAGLDTENAFLLQLGDDAEWTNRSGEGVLAIEAIVRGENLPQCNITAKSLTLQPIYSVEEGSLKGSVLVRNNALKTITGFDIVCTVDDALRAYTCHIDTELAFRAEQSYDFVINPEEITGAAPLHHSLTVTLTNLTEGEDQYPADNTVSGYFDVMTKYFQRNVLVEEFTTENCVNCPRVAGFMHEMLETDNLQERVNVLCHHSGFGEDWLTIYADKAYTWLYGSIGVFAPALLVDRVSSDVTSTQDPGSPIFFPESAEHIVEAVKWRMEQAAFVDLNIVVTLSEDNAHVVVRGERASEVFSQNAPRIVVGLIEDNVPARYQTGAELGYIQQHVNRCYNSTWGHQIEWDGDNYTYECDLKVDEAYVKENLSVVAYIWDYDPTDAAKCEICNSNRVKYPDMTIAPAGLSSSLIDQEINVEYYTLQGLKVNNPSQGTIYLQVKDGKASKVIFK